MFLILYFFNPCVAEWFPYFPDLVCARSWLDWGILPDVVPWWAYAVVHIWKEDLGAGDIEKFRYSGHVKMHSTVI